MRINNLLIGLAAIVLGAYVFASGYSMPSLPHLRFGPGFFPCIVGAALALTGAGLAGGAMRASERARLIQLDPLLKTGKAQIGVLLMLGSPVAYILASDTLGFIPTAALIAFGGLLWFWRRPVAALFLSIVVVMAIQLFFGRLMKVPLPLGVLEPYQGSLSWML